MKTFGWIVFIFFALLIGVYPLTYFIFDMSGGLLSSKSQALIASRIWSSAFYLHISFGAISMLTGWSQFSKRIRNKNLKLHRTLGKIYLIAVTISGFAGLYIAFYATGGIVAQAGFTGLALGWLYSSFQAYSLIRKRDIDQHQYWMIRSYAFCWAAVTLRIWLPLFQFALGMDFITAYRIIAWLCWVPNLIVAEIIVRNLKAQRSISNTVQ